MQMFKYFITNIPPLKVQLLPTMAIFYTDLSTIFVTFCKSEYQLGLTYLGVEWIVL